MLEMKVQIAIDEEKAKKDGINPQEIYALLDTIFSKSLALKEQNTDGSLIYSSNPKRATHTFSDFGLVYVKLRNSTLFGKYCKEWLVFDKNSYKQEFTKDNVLERARKENPLFAV